MLSAHTIEHLKDTFENAGGMFATSISSLAEKIKKIRVCLFDWDGVFNDGLKSEHIPSGFSEADSMGLNLMRYALWRQTEKLLPFILISGQSNAAAEYFAERENFNAVYTNFKRKEEVFARILEKYQCLPEEVAFFFDDVIDLSVAKQCGVRLLISRKASPLFREYVMKNNLCDYATFSEGGGHALREAGELVIALSDDYEKILRSRLDYDDSYKKYWEVRKACTTSKAVGIKI